MKLSELKVLKENDNCIIGENSYEMNQGVLQPARIVTSSAQKQTQKTFGFKWKKEDTFNSEASLNRMKSWLLERYQEPQNWLDQLEVENPTVLDAGCGAGMSGFEYWGGVADKIQYMGIDISEAVHVAHKRASEKGFRNSLFMQQSIDQLPFQEPLFDIIFSEGVLHHTDNTHKTFSHLSKLLKSGGFFMFYVYRKKGPIREFTDDYIRDKLQSLSPEEGWDELKSLTQLGIELGKLDLEINVPEDVKVLGIPSGKINLQRLFYWNIFKAFYDPNLSFDEMHHINFDWYAPKNAHRHTVVEVQSWCDQNNLTIEHLKEEDAGITCVARKK
jgi:ubiquinone/menaquinone biosynthesis C-methylase UbiE